jgi:tetratricopeptide (TPR) repeat protein
MRDKYPLPVPARATATASRNAKLVRQAEAMIAREVELMGMSDHVALKALGDEASALAGSLAGDDPQAASLAAELEYICLFTEFVRSTPDFEAHANRAAALAQAAGRNDTLAKVLALSAAHHGELDNLEAQIKCLHAMRDVASADNHVAWCMAHMQVASSLQWLCAFELAGRHYRPALVMARASADVGREVACLNHMARLQATEVHTLWQAGKASPFALAHAEADLRERVADTQKRLPQRSLVFTELCIASMLALQEQYAQALAIYEIQIPILIARNLSRHVYPYLSRKAMCLLALGRHDEALATSEEAVRGAVQHGDQDALMPVHGDRETMLRTLNRHAEADVHKALREQAQNEIEALRARYLDDLLHALDPLPTKPVATAKQKRR